MKLTLMLYHYFYSLSQRIEEISEIFYRRYIRLKTLNENKAKAKARKIWDTTTEYQAILGNKLILQGIPKIFEGNLGNGNDDPMTITIANHNLHDSISEFCNSRFMIRITVEKL